MLIIEHKQEYNRQIIAINAMSEETLSDMLKAGKCPMPVEHLVGVPLGMFHCDLCGTMVCAGATHPDLDPPWHPDKSIVAEQFYGNRPELWNKTGDLEWTLELFKRLKDGLPELRSKAT